MSNSKIVKSQLGWPTRLARFAPWYLLLRFPNRTTRSVFAAVGGTIAIGIMCTVAAMTAQPMIFPSLGPTAFLFFTRPSSQSSSPRNAILGHGWGVLIGAITYVVLTAIYPEPTTMSQVMAASLSLGIISAVMVIFSIEHPPAASTTLIMSLGLMTELTEFAAVMIAVVLLTYLAVGINRLTGISCPLWSFTDAEETEKLVTSALKTEVTRERPISPYAALADNVIVVRGG